MDGRALFIYNLNCCFW